MKIWNRILCTRCVYFRLFESCQAWSLWAVLCYIYVVNIFTFLFFFTHRQLSQKIPCGIWQQTVFNLEYSCYYSFDLTIWFRLGRLARLLLRLPALRLMSSSITEELFFTGLIGNVPIDSIIPYILKMETADYNSQVTGPSVWPHSETLSHATPIILCPRQIDRLVLYWTDQQALPQEELQQWRPRSISALPHKYFGILYRVRGMMGLWVPMAAHLLPRK